MRGRLGMNTEPPMHIMHLPSSRAFNSRGYRQILWYAPSTMVLVLRSGQYRTPRYFDVAHTEDHRVPYALVASCTEHHGIWTRATPWCPVEYRVCCGVLPQCMCVWCGVWGVCGWASPECAAVAQCPRVRAPSAVLQRLRQHRISSSLIWDADCRC
jgi:hypothetical protein